MTSGLACSLEEIVWLHTAAIQTRAVLRVAGSIVVVCYLLTRTACTAEKS